MLKITHRWPFFQFLFLKGFFISVTPVAEFLPATSRYTLQSPDHKKHSLTQIYGTHVCKVTQTFSDCITKASQILSETADDVKISLCGRLKSKPLPKVPARDYRGKKLKVILLEWEHLQISS